MPTELEWLVIDLDDRPDLRDMLTSGTWWRRTCTGCGAEIRRPEPLALVGLSPEAPLVMAHSPETPVEDPDLVENMRSFEGAVAATAVNPDVAPPVVPAPFPVVALAARRDVGWDLAQADEVEIGPTGRGDEGLADAYGLFLDRLDEVLPARRRHQAANYISRASTVDEVRAAFERFPELQDGSAAEVYDQSAGAGSDAEERRVQEARARLIRRAATGDIDEAWAAYGREVAGVLGEELMPRLEAREEAMRRSSAAGDLRDAADLGEELLESAIHLWEELPLAALLADVAGYHAQVLGHDRSEHIERAIELSQRARGLLADLDDPEVRRLRVVVAMNEAVTYGQRIAGDRVANNERAVARLEEAIALLDPGTDGDAWPMAKTNLGLTLTQLADSQPLEHRAETLGAALGHFEDALRYRTFESEPLGWAYTHINAGTAHTHWPDDHDGTHARLALDHFANALRAYDQVGDAAAGGQVLENMGRTELNLATADGMSTGDRRTGLERAEGHLRASLVRRPLEMDPVGAGRTHALLAEVREAASDPEGAMAAYRQALQGLTPESAPAECRQAARRAAEIAAERDDWPEAADLWDVAVQAAARAVDARADSSGRFAELEANTNVWRWAAYALTRAGRAARAVEVLELGRTRELSSWLRDDTVDVERLQTLDPALADQYARYAQALDETERRRRAGQVVPLTQVAETRERLDAVLAQVRSLPGLGSFLARRSFADIADDVEAGTVLAYLVTAPAGSAVLVVDHGDPTGGPQVIDVPDLTSRQVAEALIGHDPSTGTYSGYFPTQITGDGDLDAGIASMAAVLGPSLLRPLAEFARDRGASTICLIPTGLLGLLPLQALWWPDGNRNRCLLDDAVVTVAPSALAHTVGRRRAETMPDEVRLLCVGNPLPLRHLPPLSGAESEARLVAETFPADTIETLTREQATKEAVIDGLRSATHAHLACHGQVSAEPTRLDAALFLAGEEKLRGAEILDLAPLRLRLVVASACETGINPGYETADEALSLGTIFIGAGAAGVVASLWQVDDDATALLMHRFYALLANGEPPPSALRLAQLWFRDAGPDERRAYAQRHLPDGAGETRRSAGTSGNDRPAAAGPAASAWAAFTYSGG